MSLNVRTMFRADVDPVVAGSKRGEVLLDKKPMQSGALYYMKRATARGADLTQTEAMCAVVEVPYYSLVNCL